MKSDNRTWYVGVLRRARVAISTLAALTVAAITSAPSASANTLWAAIVYHSGSNGVEKWWYWNYPGKTELILKIQDDHPDAGYQLFHSGECGAVASYEDISGDTQFGRGVANDLDAATSKAIQNTSGGRYTLQKAMCQN